MRIQIQEKIKKGIPLSKEEIEWQEKIKKLIKKLIKSKPRVKQCAFVRKGNELLQKMYPGIKIK